MKLEEALELLGIPEGSDEEQIRKRFRELARELHPDAGGDPLLMARLYAARDIVLGGSGDVALIPIDDVQELVARQTALVSERYEGRVAKQRTIDRLKFRHTRPLSRLKRITGAVGLLAGILGILAFDILPAAGGSGTALSDAMRLSLILLAGFAALAFLILNHRVEVIQGDLDDLSASLSDKNFYLDLMREVLPTERRGTFWSKLELTEFLSNARVPRTLDSLGAPDERRGDRDRPPHPFSMFFPRSPEVDSPSGTIRQLYPAEAADLLITSGRERGLLEEQEEVGPDEGFVVRYRVIEVPGESRKTKTSNKAPAPDG